MPQIINATFNYLYANDSSTTYNDAVAVVYENFANETTPTVPTIPDWLLLSYGQVKKTNFCSVFDHLNSFFEILA